jgi:membrane protein CcdC involved in cytochrome C biogenesis
MVTIPLADSVRDPAAALRIAAGAGLLFSILHMLTLALRVRRLEIHLTRPRWILVVIIDLVVIMTGALALGFATTAAYEWLLVVMLARPMLAFVLVLADVAEA